MNKYRKLCGSWLLGLALLVSGVVHADSVTYVYTDPQGTPLANADVNGNITATFDYAPYGSIALGTAPNGPGYTGHVNDPDTGFVYMQARYYDPAVGRFLSVDPVGPKAGNAFDFNRYGYANNNPVINTDPTGTTCVSSGKDGTYQCTVDDNKGHFSKSDLAQVNKAYTRAVNALEAHPSRNVTVTVDGKHFEANAGKVASALISAKIETSSLNTTARANTYGGGIGTGNAGHLIYQPVTTIYSNVLTKDREGGSENVASDMSRTFVHEGIHMQPGESVMFDMNKYHQQQYEVDHQAKFNAASDVLYGNGH